MNRSSFILIVIVVAQFCCTSLWFASNAVMEELILYFDLYESALGYLTSAVQFGFITGTFFFALLTVSDRYPPSNVFFFCAVIGALFNLGIIWSGHNLLSLISLRILTGFCLAGIYPVGMKIAADYFEKGLGRSLGYLVGALVLGTALPHGLVGYGIDLPWRYTLIAISMLAVLGGLAILALVPIGPYRSVSQGLDIGAIYKVFGSRDFRSAAFGYFGHMWELYAFWVFVPVMVQSYLELHSYTTYNISRVAFWIIAAGSLGCIIGGYLSEKLGKRNIAMIALMISGLCCLISPVIYQLESFYLFFFFLSVWGFFVVMDSPMFSTLVAQSAVPHLKGTALTITNSIGFAITIISIQLLSSLYRSVDPRYILVVLVIGPILGLWATYRSDDD